MNIIESLKAIQCPNGALVIPARPEELNHTIEKTRRDYGANVIIIVLGCEPGTTTGACHYIANGVSQADLLKKLSEMIELSGQIDGIYRKGGLIKRLTGHIYAKEAVRLILSYGHERPLHLKEIYCEIAVKHSSTARKVERAIGRMIETTGSGHTYPTNSQFLRMAVETVRMNSCENRKRIAINEDPNPFKFIGK